MRKLVPLKYNDAVSRKNLKKVIELKDFIE